MKIGKIILKSTFDVLAKPVSVILLLVGFVGFVVIHRVFYGIFGYEEPIFYTLAFLCLYLFIVSSIAVLIVRLNSGKDGENG